MDEGLRLQTLNSLGRYGDPAHEWALIKKRLRRGHVKGHVKRYPLPPLRYGGGSISGAMIITTMI